MFPCRAYDEACLRSTWHSLSARRAIPGASCASAETTRWNCLTAGPERRPTATADKHRSASGWRGIMSACGEHKEEVSRAGNGGRAENTRRRPCGLGLGRAAREPRAQASDFLAAAPWRHSRGRARYLEATYSAHSLCGVRVTAKVACLHHASLVAHPPILGCAYRSGCDNAWHPFLWETARSGCGLTILPHGTDESCRGAMST